MSVITKGELEDWLNDDGDDIYHRTGIRDDAPRSVPKPKKAAPKKAAPAKPKKAAPKKAAPKPKTPAKPRSAAPKKAAPTRAPKVSIPKPPSRNGDPRDGDGDGLIFDGTPRQRPAVPKALGLSLNMRGTKRFKNIAAGRAANPPKKNVQAWNRIFEAAPLTRFDPGLYDLRSDIVNDLAEALEVMSSDYPEVVLHLQDANIMPVRERTVGGSKASAYIESNHEICSLSINPDMDDAMVLMERDRQFMRHRGFRGNVTADPRAVFLHEFGHVIQAREFAREVGRSYKNSRVQPGDPDAIPNALRNRDRGTSGSLVAWAVALASHGGGKSEFLADVALSVSFYATQNPVEFQAEIWAMAHAYPDRKLHPSLEPVLASMKMAARKPFTHPELSYVAQQPRSADSSTVILKEKKVPRYKIPKRRFIDYSGTPNVGAPIITEGKKVIAAYRIDHMPPDPADVVQRPDILEKRRKKQGLVSPFSTPKEITGSHGHRPHGKSIRWPALYEHLREKGMTKAKAAAISNAAWKKNRLGIPTNTPMSAIGVAKSEDEATFTGEIVKVNEDKQLVFGWAYVTHDQLGELNVDGSGEFVDDPNELEKAAYDFVLKARTGDSDHDMTVKSTLVESMVFTPEKIKALGLKQGDLPIGWWAGWKVHDPEVWDGVKKGKYASFSIFGRSTKKDITT